MQPTITKDNDLIVRSDYQEVTLTHSFTPLNLTLKDGNVYSTQNEKYLTIIGRKFIGIYDDFIKRQAGSF